MFRARYEAYGWHTALVEDGTDLAAIDAAINEAKASGKPSLIEVKTVIGYGSPNKQGTNAVHGAPLGAEKLKLLVKPWAGTMLHLRFLRKSMQTTVQM